MFSGEFLALAINCCDRPGDMFKYEGIVYEVVERLIQVNVVKTRRRMDVPSINFPELKTRLQRLKTIRDREWHEEQYARR